MVKIKIFKTMIILFVLVFNVSISLAEVNNPFTIKGKNEFTKQDREKLENKINSNVNNRILSLENKLKREIEELKKKSVEESRAPRRDVGMDRGIDRDIDGEMAPVMRGPDGLIIEEEIIEEVVKEKSPVQIRIENSTFIGCIDEKALFKDNENNEKFFVSQEEVEDYDEFNKVGGCSF